MNASAKRKATHSTSDLYRACRFCRDDNRLIMTPDRNRRFKQIRIEHSQRELYPAAATFPVYVNDPRL
jgi:hypothetical protein